jgi:hypothetical protein
LRRSILLFVVIVISDNRDSIVLFCRLDLSVRLSAWRLCTLGVCVLIVFFLLLFNNILLLVFLFLFVLFFAILIVGLCALGLLLWRCRRQSLEPRNYHGSYLK